MKRISKEELARRLAVGYISCVSCRRRYGGITEALRRQHLNGEDEIQEIKSLWKVCGDAYDQQHNG